MTMKGFACQGITRCRRVTFMPPSLTLTLSARLAVYWSRGRVWGCPMLALRCTKHWLGMPRKLSDARLTSLYSSAPANQTQQRQLISLHTNLTVWRENKSKHNQPARL